MRTLREANYALLDDLTAQGRYRGHWSAVGRLLLTAAKSGGRLDVMLATDALVMALEVEGWMTRQPRQAHQAMAIGFVPPLPALLADWGQRYFDETSRCPTCDELAIERELAVRVIEDAPHFLAIAPFAAEHPSEVWIVPKEHRASFVDTDEPQRRELARLLRRMLSRLRQERDDPPYNFVIDSAARPHLRSPFVHWRLRIAPELATWGGFELGAGTPVNPSRPRLCRRSQ